MNRSLSLASILLSLALAHLGAGCSPKCGPSTCTGCCDAQGICQAPTADHCGQNGAACSTCVGFQLCLVGSCQLPGGAAASTSAGAGSGSGTGASASGATSSGATTAAGSSDGTTTAGSASSATGTSGATTAGTAAASTTTAGTTGTVGSTASAGTTGGSSSAASSSGSGTTGGLLGICATCSQNADCASSYCDSSLHYCNSAFACLASDCAPYGCGADGNCVCNGGTTGTSGTTGSSTGGTTGSGLPICFPCSQNSQCLSGYCNVFSGYCDSTQACSPDGGPTQDCGGFTCDTQTGSCVCSVGTTGGTSGSTGTSGGPLTDGGPDQCGINRVTIGCATQACPLGYTCTSGTCVLDGASGALQVTLRWGTNDDLDLHLIEPSGCEIYYGNKTCTGTLDHSAGEGCGGGTTVYEENATFSATPPAGTYTVKADFWQSCANADPVPYEVVVRKGSSTSVTCGTFHPADADNGAADAGRLVTTFTYP